jgi:hypothetical protein
MPSLSFFAKPVSIHFIVLMMWVYNISCMSVSINKVDTKDAQPKHIMTDQEAIVTKFGNTGT